MEVRPGPGQDKGVGVLGAVALFPSFALPLVMAHKQNNLCIAALGPGQGNLSHGRIIPSEGKGYTAAMPGLLPSVSDCPDITVLHLEWSQWS